MTYPSAEFDLAIRERIELRAAPTVVWAYLERLEAWKSSVAAVERLAGSPGRAGELIRVQQRSGQQTVPVLMRTLRLDAPLYRVQTLDTEIDRATRGYVIYSLDAHEQGCRVTCDVVAKCEVPVAALEGRTVEEFAQAVNEATRLKLAADHAALRALIERDAVPDGAR